MELLSTWPCSATASLGLSGEGVGKQSAACESQNEHSLPADAALGSRCGSVLLNVEFCCVVQPVSSRLVVICNPES